MKLYQAYLTNGIILAAAYLIFGCATPQAERAVVANGLKLTRAVLYQNGVGYFERRGTVDGDKVTVRIRADQVNDFLKSLTVIDASDGMAVSVSLPLDRDAAAQVLELSNKLKEGIGLPDLLEALKGTRVTLIGKDRSASGRMLALDEVATEDSLDWRVSVMGEQAVSTVMLSDVITVYVEDEFIVLGLHKGLDAAATGGVFKVVDVTVHMDRGGAHDLLVSYVVECPAWKPSYRLVVDKGDQALLQGWAVVDNVTGEAWDKISLSLTSGAPLAFQYDLYAPRFVARPDLSHVANQKVARAAVGETSYDEAAVEEEEAAAKEAPLEDMAETDDEMKVARPRSRKKKPAAPKSAPTRLKAMEVISKEAGAAAYERDKQLREAEVSVESLQASARSMVTASRASGAVRYDMTEPVSVPDRSSTLVSILNQTVPGEEAFLFTPEGAGQGYEQNPYRVARFENTTGFVLEPGPISIYSGGAFVGEGIGEAVSSQKMATIPFAVDPFILVTSSRVSRQEGARLIKIHKGLMTVESFDRIKTTYTVKGGTEERYRLYVRHAKAGGSYELKDKPKGTEDLGDAYLLPIDVKKKNKETRFEAVEQTPVTRSLTIWDHDTFKAIELFLSDVEDLPEESRKKLEDILDKRRRISKIDTELEHLERKRDELDGRMNQTRENLRSLKKNKAAAPLKARLGKKLEEYAKEADAVAQKIVELTDDRLELKIAVDDAVADLTL